MTNTSRVPLSSDGPGRPQIYDLDLASTLRRRTVHSSSLLPSGYAATGLTEEYHRALSLVAFLDDVSGGAVPVSGVVAFTKAILARTVWTSTSGVVGHLALSPDDVEMLRAKQVKVSSLICLVPCGFDVLLYCDISLPSLFVKEF